MKQVTNETGYLGLLSRRRLLQGAAVGGFGLGVAALIGCGDDDDDDAAAPAPAAATAAAAATEAPAATEAAATATAATAATPTATAALQAATETATAAPAVATKHGGFLQFIQPAGYQGTNIDPYYTDTSVGINIIMGKMFYESLLNTDFSNVEWRSPYSIVPWLAESWEQPDDVTYTLAIRGGVQFHNGATLSADDVGFTYERATAEDAIRNNWKSKFADFEVVDGQTIKLVAPGPNAEFLESVNSYIGQVAIMPRSAEAAGLDFSIESAGTGPFRVKDWQADSQTTVTRFENYWGGGHPGGEVGRPYLDGLRISPGDDATQSAAFIAGELDILSRNDRIQAKPILDAVPEAKTVGFPSEYIYGIGFNQLHPPFGDLRIRQAVHLAISRQDVDAAANFGDGVISGPMIIEREGYTLSNAELLQQPGYREAKDADRAEAVKLMAAAGFADGLSADLVYNTRLAVAPVYAEAVQPQLKEVLGIDLTLVPMDTASYSQARGAQPAEIDGLFVHLRNGVARPSTGVAPYRSSHASSKSVGWNDPKIDALIDAAEREFDVEARGAIFKQLEQAMIDGVLWASISAPSLIRMQQPWVYDWRDNRAQRQSIMNPSWIWMDVTEAPENRLS